MLHPFLGRTPVHDETNFIAPSADVIGDVKLGRGTSVWFNTVIRGDVNWIRIGEESNVQDGSVLHVTNRVAPLSIGNRVTVGHGAIVHGCTIRDRVLVGMGAVVMDHAEVGEDTIVGARALVTAGVKIPPRSLVLGAPAKVIRELTDEEVASILHYAENYVRYSRIYLGLDSPAEHPFYDPSSAP